MSPTVITASGKQFDVDKFVADTGIKPAHLYRIGEPRGPRGRRGIHELSGIVIDVTDGDDLAEQILEAEAFVEANLGILERLRDWPGVDEPVLDFGYNSRIGKGTDGQRITIACDRFDASFLLKLGRLGLGIELTLYPGHT
jgi:hypothetical protein